MLGISAAYFYSLFTMIAGIFNSDPDYHPSPPKNEHDADDARPTREAPRKQGERKDKRSADGPDVVDAVVLIIWVTNI